MPYDTLIPTPTYLSSDRTILVDLRCSPTFITFLLYIHTRQFRRLLIIPYDTTNLVMIFHRVFPWLLHFSNFALFICWSFNIHWIPLNLWDVLLIDCHAKLFHNFTSTFPMRGRQSVKIVFNEFEITISKIC